MKKTPLRTLGTHVLWTTTLLLGMTKIAKSQSPEIPESTNATPVNTVEIADGNAKEFANLGMKFAAPKGWEILTNNPQLTLVAQEPKSEKIVYDQATYQRNITLATIHKASPIDETRVAEFREELTKAFGTQGAVKNFQILETKFFDYKAKNDGLVAFSTFSTAEANMMQMHVLVSGSDKQFLMTYTDLQDKFNTPETYGAAWTSMTSIDVTGVPAGRYDQMFQVGIPAAVVLLLLVVLVVWRRRKASYKMANFEDFVDSDMGGDEDFSSNDASESKSQHSAHGHKIVGNQQPLSFVSNF